ncbi:phosphotransferase enzyme family protein [Streptomyces sp. FIT100]|uniref:phosphotransferase enzyme family protein n=1 Tax=Streptomyces sp. FIT100 TaxID=2837956 RepID=UPI0021C5D95E|nr:phosphotransferase [Streptomyces sp. FIT100]UUN30832.1 phosphotransferase [Streptomyces sp. FIT100]
MGKMFNELARATRLKWLRSAAFETLEHYAIPRNRLKLLQYEDNAVYLVEGDGMRHVLRMSVHDGRSAQEQSSELAWIDSLVSGKAVIAPKPVPTRSTGMVTSLALPRWPEPVTSVVFEWIPGESSPASLSATAAEQLGRLTANLHEHAMQYRPPADFTRPTWGYGEIFEGGAAVTDPVAHDRLSDTERALLLQVCRTVCDRLPERTPHEWGLIHADLHRGNVVATPDDDVAVIDFDDCGPGYYMLDVASVLSSFLRTCDPQEYPEFTERYVRGYRSIRGLPPSAERLSEFLVMRDMIILNFVLSSRNEAVLEWGPARSKGILNTMRDYLSSGKYPGHLNLAAL